MPKLPPLRPREILRVLEGFGFQKHKETGSAHIVLVHTDGRRTVISRHNRTIPRGTLGGILRDINIGTEEFLVAYKPKRYRTSQ